MKKLFNLAILLIMMATPMFLVSCGDDDILPEESENEKPTITSWTEPFHENGASMDDVKSYMANLLTCYSLVSESNSMSSIHLTYASDSFGEGIIYSFTVNQGSLYSVIDTELTVNRVVIFRYLNEHYTLVPGSSSNDELLQYHYTNQDKSIIISTRKVSETCFNIDYTFVLK